MNRAVFIDRDGIINKAIVVNRKPFSPVDIYEFKILPKAKKALKTFKKLNLMNIIITNQPDIKTGKQLSKDLDKIHNWMMINLDIDEILVCKHDDNDNCNCRKPKTGMIEQAVEKYQINISQSYLIGDRWKDIQCGQKAGCKENFFVNYNYNETRPKMPYIVVKSLYECSQYLNNTLK
jgi:D-glycero-D-manno-heptose 1,7-bisphosphate phosphatase